MSSSGTGGMDRGGNTGGRVQTFHVIASIDLSFHRCLFDVPVVLRHKPSEDTEAQAIIGPWIGNGLVQFQCFNQRKAPDLLLAKAPFFVSGVSPMAHLITRAQFTNRIQPAGQVFVVLAGRWVRHLSLQAFVSKVVVD